MLGVVPPVMLVQLTGGSGTGRKVTVASSHDDYGGSGGNGWVVEPVVLNLEGDSSSGNLGSRLLWDLAAWPSRRRGGFQAPAMLSQ